LAHFVPSHPEVAIFFVNEVLSLFFVSHMAVAVEDAGSNQYEEAKRDVFGA
jgi:hypothetical protein